MSLQNPLPPKPKARTKNHSKAWWLKQFKEWQSSGLSKSEFCTANNLKTSSFYNWACQFQHDQTSHTKEKSAPRSTSAFIPAHIVGSKPTAQVSKLSFGSITLQFDSGLSSGDLPAWIQILRAASC